MIKSFGWYDPSVDYIECNASYLLFVDSYFRVPIVQSKEGFFLVGGGIEEEENFYDCLKREIMEEIGGTVDKLSLICETQTYDCFILGKSVNCGFSCFGGGQLASVVLISMYSAIRRNSSANLK